MLACGSGRDKSQPKHVSKAAVRYHQMGTSAKASELGLGDSQGTL